MIQPKRASNKIQLPLKNSWCKFFSFSLSSQKKGRTRTIFLLIYMGSFNKTRPKIPLIKPNPRKKKKKRKPETNSSDLTATLNLVLQLSPSYFFAERWEYCKAKKRIQESEEFAFFIRELHGLVYNIGCTTRLNYNS